MDNWKKYSYNGKLIHGKFHGPWIGYDSNGGIWSKENFDMGKLVGYNIVHWFNGDLRYKRFYAN